MFSQSITRKRQHVKSFMKLSSSGLNPRRYFWLFIGYYIVSVSVRAIYAQDVNPPPTRPSPPPKLDESPEPEVHLFVVDWAHISQISIVTLWITCATFAKIAFHMTPKLGHIFPESCLLIVVGILIGAVLYVTNVDIGDSNRLPTSAFFFVMLPPIILDAGYFMPNRLFFGNLGTILVFAVVGTLWNTFSIGITLWGFQSINLFGVEINTLQIFLFSSLISAVDPVAVLAVFEEVHVNDILYIIVFGESLLNDAVTIVLYHTFGALTEIGPDKITSTHVVRGILSFPIVSLGGTIFGVIWGFIIGFGTRFTSHVLVIEPVFVLVMSYLAFLSAELFHFSGVLTLIFCGITMKNYVQANIAPTSNTTVKYTLKMLSSSSETVIFIFLGVSTMNEHNVWNWWFVGTTIICCTVYRFIGIFFFTSVVNQFRMNKLGFVDQVVMSYGGLRGAVSFALVLLIEDDVIEEEVRHMFITTTIAMVYFTVFFQGTTIKPLVEWLRVKRAQSRELTLNERIHERLFENTVITMEAILGTIIGHNQIRDKFRHIDTKFIRPLLIRDYENRQETKLIETFETVVMKDAMDDFKRRCTISKEIDNEIKMVDPEVSEKPRAHVIRRRRISTFKPPTKSPKISVANSIFDTDEIFRPIRQRKISYNRHALEYSDLDDDFSSTYTDSIGPFPPTSLIGKRAIRKIGVANSALYTPSRSTRVSREEYSFQHTNSLPPKVEITHVDEEPSRFIVRPSGRTVSVGGRFSRTPLNSERPVSIAEDPEDTLDGVASASDDVFE